MYHDDEWPEDVPLPIDHSLVPESIRQAAIEMMEPGAKLHRVPVDSAIGFEYWLIAADGELIESFWLE